MASDIVPDIAKLVRSNLGSTGQQDGDVFTFRVGRGEDRDNIPPVSVEMIIAITKLDPVRPSCQILVV